MEIPDHLGLGQNKLEMMLQHSRQVVFLCPDAVQTAHKRARPLLIGIGSQMHVYVITNTVNGKMYVGQHLGPNLQRYFRGDITRVVPPRWGVH